MVQSTVICNGNRINCIWSTTYNLAIGVHVNITRYKILTKRFVPERRCVFIILVSNRNCYGVFDILQ